MLNNQPQIHRPVDILSPDEIERIHTSSLEILAHVGVQLQGTRGMDCLASYRGVRAKDDRAFLSPEFIEWAIEQAPRTYNLYAQDHQYDIALGQGNVFYSSGFGAPFIADLRQQRVREATLQDSAQYLKLADSLENVHLVLTPFVPQDIDPQMAEIAVAVLQFLLTRKHIGIGVPNADYLDLIDTIASQVACESGAQGPVYSLGATINSPLTLTDTMQRKILFAAERRIPMRIVCGAIAGATAPVTFAGALAMQNAEILAGIALAQAANPGCPVIYGTFVGGMDMRTGKWTGGTPGTALMTAASAQLCRRYGIPLAYGTAGVSDSHVPDVRAGLEKGLSLLATALSKVEVIHNGVSGLLASGMAINFEQFVIDNEIAHWVNRYLRGIQVDQPHLAFDVIKEIGPGGEFMSHEHTVRYCREEHLITPLFQREYRLDWPTAPLGTMLEQASLWVDETLDSAHVPTPPGSVLSSIKDALFEIRKNHALYDNIMTLIEQ